MTRGPAGELDRPATASGEPSVGDPELEAAGAGAPEVAATVGGEPVLAADVDAEVGRLRAGPQARRLPAAGTQDGRQLRRWVTQRVVLRRLLEQEAATRALTPSADTAAGDRAEQRHENGEGLRFTGTTIRPDPAVLGAATADVLATSAAARAVYAAVTAGESADETDLVAYHRRNIDRYTVPDRWTIRTARSEADLTAATAVPIDPATLPPTIRSALAAAGTGRPVDADTSGAWAHLYVVLDAVRPGGVRPYGEVRDEVAAVVLDRRRQLSFARWVDARAAAVVTLRPGYEHPADPGNPDATHRH